MYCNVQDMQNQINQVIIIIYTTCTHLFAILKTKSHILAHISIIIIYNCYTALKKAIRNTIKSGYLYSFSYHLSTFKFFLKLFNIKCKSF